MGPPVRVKLSLPGGARMCKDGLRPGASGGVLEPEVHQHVALGVDAVTAAEWEVHLCGGGEEGVAGQDAPGGLADTLCSASARARATLFLPVPVKPNRRSPPPLACPCWAA